MSKWWLIPPMSTTAFVVAFALTAAWQHRNFVLVPLAIWGVIALFL